MLPIYYINLNARTDRRAHMEAQFVLLALGATRIEAVRPDNAVATLSRRGWLRNAFHRLDPATLCRTLSHAEVLDHIVRSNAPLSLVLEDDALLAEGLPDFLKSIEDLLPGHVDLVRLETCYHPAALGREALLPRGPVGLRRLCGTQPGSAAYLVRPQAASAILKGLPQTGEAIDDMLFSSFGWGLFNLTIGQTVPGLAVELDKRRSFAHLPMTRGDVAPAREAMLRQKPKTLLTGLKSRSRLVRAATRQWSHFGAHALWGDKEDVGFADDRRLRRR
jgi:GR25 family glycosyltransferase involved in LPS biosynthesis